MYHRSICPPYQLMSLKYQFSVSVNDSENVNIVHVSLISFAFPLLLLVWIKTSMHGTYELWDIIGPLSGNNDYVFKWQ